MTTAWNTGVCSWGASESINKNSINTNGSCLDEIKLFKSKSTDTSEISFRTKSLAREVIDRWINGFFLDQVIKCIQSGALIPRLAWGVRGPVVRDLD